MRTIAQAKRLLKNTAPTDDKFGGQWKNHYSGKYMYAIADDDTFVIAAIDGWNPLAVCVNEYEYSEDVNELPVMVRILSTGKIEFAHGMDHAYRLATLKKERIEK